MLYTMICVQVKEHVPSAPIILVGTKSDLRNDEESQRKGTRVMHLLYAESLANGWLCIPLNIARRLCSFRGNWKFKETDWRRKVYWVFSSDAGWWVTLQKSCCRCCCWFLNFSHAQFETKVLRNRKDQEERKKSMKKKRESNSNFSLLFSYFLFARLLLFFTIIIIFLKNIRKAIKHNKCSSTFTLFSALCLYVLVHDCMYFVFSSFDPVNCMSTTRDVSFCALFMIEHGCTR